MSIAYDFRAKADLWLNYNKNVLQTRIIKLPDLEERGSEKPNQLPIVVSAQCQR